MVQAPAEWLAAHREQLFGELLNFISIPSVSTDPAYADGMRRAAAILMAQLVRIGLDRPRLIENGGHAAVYAEWLGVDGAPTILIYGHYDVQPPDPVDLWRSPPFEPTVRDHCVYGRGASDDKGPLWTMLAALEAMLATGGLPLNVKLLLEGEEEVGSRTMAGILRRHSELLRADVVISADGARWRHDTIDINTNCRGICALDFSVKTARGDLHSGRYGGAVANAATVAARLVATLHDETGRIAVPGFYEGLRPPSDIDRASIAAIGFDEAAFLADVAARTGAVERGVPILEAMWLRPTLEVNGIWGGYAGPGVKTVLPHQAGAKITCRLGVGQDPDRVARTIETHLRTVCPSTADLIVIQQPGRVRAYAVPDDNPALMAVERVLERLHGTRPLHVGGGGTLPFSTMVKEILGIETIMVSCAVSDSDAHAPNEFFRISSFDEGLRVWLMLLPELAAM